MNRDGRRIGLLFPDDTSLIAVWWRNDAPDYWPSLKSGLCEAATNTLGMPSDTAEKIEEGQAWVQGRPIEEIRAENDMKAIIPRHLA